ncbi:MAG: hypothetical protein ABR927_07515 [Bacteroidales bacterium]|jgi:hypothetical protein
MKLVFEYIGFILLLLILGLSIWNTLNLRSIKNQIIQSGKFSKEYFEIKYRLQLITTIGSIIAAIIVFYGYNSEKMIDESFNRSIELAIHKNDTLITKKYNEYLGRISSTESKIKSIENKEIINAEIYIIKNYNVKTANFLENSAKIYYKELPNTISGKKLPVFKNPPVINLIPTNGSEFTIKKVTKDYFEIKIYAFFYETSSFDIWFAL